MTPEQTVRRDFRRVLIANRGEIAIRIARAAREADLVPLGIYSEADAGARHLGAMDDALCIGPAEASHSYLDGERILAAARALGADALHPGYGFLSERAPFARAVRDAGLVFIGPSAEAIAAMGDKSEAKRRASERGVPVVPGYSGSERDPGLLRAEAERIGTPLLVKATAGGGGRGMRVVTDLARFDEAVASARREAAAAFGDDEILLEKYVERPRHIEFQILADAYGNTIHLGERECSIQRRHQKLVEEAPSVALSDGALRADSNEALRAHWNEALSANWNEALRASMGAAAVRAAQSVAYTNAGTVEFLLAPDGAFYFLEMNARLQVEHPVTELVHGVDLVRWQFAIAAGAELTLRQNEVAARAWAIEARINAEDPENGFLPATGTVNVFEAPSGPGIRIDTGVAAGSEVGPHYDSLLAKLIVSGPTRAAAVERLTQALAAFHIGGVKTNLPVLARIAREADFRRGQTTTAYLEEHPEVVAPRPQDRPLIPALLAIGALLNDPRAWRIAGVGVALVLSAEGQTIDVTASRTGAGSDGWQLSGAFDLDLRFAVSGERVVIHGAPCPEDRSAGTALVDETGVTVTYERGAYRFDSRRTAESGRREAVRRAAVGSITSPMPGKVVAVAVAVGDAVSERDLLVVLEAMKMEHRIEATHDGTVRSVNVAPGAVVQGGATLVEIEA
jgi:3-methylcrotonyl-CoA carboxylase alpha subunit